MNVIDKLGIVHKRDMRDVNYYCYTRCNMTVFNKKRNADYWFTKEQITCLWCLACVSANMVIWL
jgi:hypothetical protein